MSTTRSSWTHAICVKKKWPCPYLKATIRTTTCQNIAQYWSHCYYHDEIIRAIAGPIKLLFPFMTARWTLWKITISSQQNNLSLDTPLQKVQYSLGKSQLSTLSKFLWKAWAWSRTKFITTKSNLVNNTGTSQLEGEKNKWNKSEQILQICWHFTLFVCFDMFQTKLATPQWEQKQQQ